VTVPRRVGLDYWVVFALGWACIVVLASTGHWWTAGAQTLLWILQIVVMARRGLFSRGER
jgi:hypothetical protein